MVGLSAGLSAGLLSVTPAAALCPPGVPCTPTQPPRPDVGQVLREQEQQRALLLRQQQRNTAALERQRAAAAQAAVEQREQADRATLEQRQRAVERQELLRRREQAGQAAAEADRDRQRHDERDRDHPRASPQLALGGHLPPGFDLERHRLHDYARHGLHPPGPKQIWLVYPPYFLLLDGATGTILDEVPDTEAGAGFLAPLYNVGIAWSAGGSWATRSGATLADAEANAVAACSAAGEPCGDAGISISADAPACYAIARGGTALFGAVETDTTTATDAALRSCAAAGATGCAPQVANCNDHP